MPRDEPPGGGPCDAGEEASGRTAVAGAAADRPGHRAECGEEKSGEDQVVGEVGSLVRGHRGTVAKGGGIYDLQFTIYDWGGGFEI